MTLGNDSVANGGVWFADLKRNNPFRRMTRFERTVWESGFARIAGVDEAGRGPLAGPIVAAAVILGKPHRGINDSKLLTPEERETAFAKLHDEAHCIGVQVIDVATIDAHGIQAANYMAMAGAAAKLRPAAEFLLVDGFRIKGCSFPQQHIIKGDQRSMSIAAASIVAKVTRDRIMVELAQQYPQYGFERHKGYSTPEHFEKLREHGPCAIHRKSFAPIAEALETANLF
ncbi:MAG: ribonuclease HII [Candidatus Hydrogenedentales bacterium]